MLIFLFVLRYSLKYSIYRLLAVVSTLITYQASLLLDRDDRRICIQLSFCGSRYFCETTLVAIESGISYTVATV